MRQIFYSISGIMTLYDENITSVSLNTLKTISELLDSPVCLCGGWAVYLTVNGFFKKQKERDYIGSQDIDIGFFLPPMITKSEFSSTSLMRTLALLESNGFDQEGFRYKKDLRLDKPVNSTDTDGSGSFSLYIDILVNSYPPSISDIYPNYFFEVPLLEDVYSHEKNQVELKGFPDNIFIPKRSILTAMKIRSLSSRDEEGHKMIKDLCDIYSLLWFSERSIHENMRDVMEFTDIDALERSRKVIDNTLMEECERHLGEPKGSMNTVLQIIDGYIH